MILNPVNLYPWLRHKLYKNGWLRQIKLNVPVVSIGNIVFGGSGKTPMVLWFLERYSSNYRIAVICQSYAAALEIPQKVLSEQAQIFGDEASLVKKKFPRVDVWSGPIKSQTAMAAANAEKYDFIIVDDGFTHHQLQRDLDLVVLDVSRPRRHYQFPPFGYLRESCASLSRAEIIILTKANADSLPLIQFFKNLLLDWKGIWGNADYLTSANVMNTNYLLFSGVGNFDHVMQTAEAVIKNKLLKKKKLPNHFDYSAQDQEKILQELKAGGFRGLTTEKDLVKIQNLELLKQTDVLQVEVKLDVNSVRWIDEKIRSLL